MPIFSYLAYPRAGELDTLRQALESLPKTEVLPAQNEELLILVTDTASDDEEAALQKELKELNSLQCMSMVFGHAENLIQED